jgi:hypothetical protein
MQVLCNGSSYDTETAKLVAGDGGNEWSNAGWHLFQTPRGSYFKVLYGHDGEEVGFSEIAYGHANELLAKHKVKPLILP